MDLFVLAQVVGVVGLEVALVARERLGQLVRQVNQLVRLKRLEPKRGSKSSALFEAKIRAYA
jgi:hypothetical protein